MGRYPAGHKEETRKKILKTASKLFREKGYEATSVDQVMKAAGLTVGGFYAHFPSKRALLVEAVNAALAKRRPLFEQVGEQLGGREWLDLVADVYMSGAHRDDVKNGCPLPALAPDIARADDESRKKFEADLLNYVDLFDGKLEDIESFPERRRALATISLLVGGMMLSRAVEDRDLSDEILSSCADLAKRTVPPTENDE